MNQRRITEEIERLNNEIAAIKRSPRNRSEKSVLITLISGEIVTLKEKHKNLEIKPND